MGSIVFSVGMGVGLAAGADISVAVLSLLQDPAPIDLAFPLGVAWDIGLTYLDAASPGLPLALGFSQTQIRTILQSCSLYL